MRHYLFKILPFLIILGACASHTAKTFVPFTPEGSESGTFKADLKTCQSYALAYLTSKGSLNPSEVAQEGSRAGLAQLGYLPIAPLAPALGAAGGASSEAVSELGLNSQEAKKIIAWCLHDKGLSHGYSVWDPNL